MTTTNIAGYVAGDTLRARFLVRTPDNSGPQDLTGATVIWRATDMPTKGGVPGAVKVTRTAGAGITLTDIAGGVVDLFVARGLLKWVQNYFHELEVTLPSGESYTPATGQIVAAPAIDRE